MNFYHVFHHITCITDETPFNGYKRTVRHTHIIYMAPLFWKLMHTKYKQGTREYYLRQKLKYYF